MRLLISSTPKILPGVLPALHPWAGVLVTPRNGALANARRLHEGWGCPWAADNDAFKEFDADAYRRMLGRIAGLPGCLWVAVPDAVGDARRTLELFDAWRGEAASAGHPLALVGQDGAEDLAVPWDGVGAWFVGGSTAWKLSAASRGLVAEALRRGKAVHFGRANSRKRYEAAWRWGCATVDGTNCCRWPDVYVPKCLRWLRQLDEQRTFLGHEGHEGKDGGA